MGFVLVVLDSPGGRTHGDEGKRNGEKANEFHVGLLVQMVEVEVMRSAQSTGAGVGSESVPCA